MKQRLLVVLAFILLNILISIYLVLLILFTPIYIITGKNFLNFISDKIVNLMIFTTDNL